MIVTRNMLSKMDKTSIVSLTARTRSERVQVLRGFYALEFTDKHTAKSFDSKLNIVTNQVSSQETVSALLTQHRANLVLQPRFFQENNNCVLVPQSRFQSLIEPHPGPPPLSSSLPARTHFANTQG